MMNKESLKALSGNFESVHPSDIKTLTTWALQDEPTTGWLKEEGVDISNMREVNHFVLSHAIDLANAINHRLHPQCERCDMVSTDAHRAEEENLTRGIEGSLKILTAAPEFQFEMELGEVLPAPYENQIALDITELLKRQTDLPISLPAGFSVIIPPGASDYHAENNPVEGFQGVGAPHEWYFGGSFEIFDQDGNTIVGYGDFSVDGLWDSEDGDVIANSLTVLNIRPGNGSSENDPDNEPSLSAWGRD